MGNRVATMRRSACFASFKFEVLRQGVSVSSLQTSNFQLHTGARPPWPACQTKPISPFWGRCEGRSQSGGIPNKPNFAFFRVENEGRVERERQFSRPGRPRHAKARCLRHGQCAKQSQSTPLWGKLEARISKSETSTKCEYRKTKQAQFRRFQG
jgi:hypothetical protein